MRIVSGTSNFSLYKNIISGNISPCLDIHVFADGERVVNINESFRDDDVYVIQSVCPPSDKNLMELMMISDALKRSSVKCVHAVIPYLGYSRQDRRIGRSSIAARIVADMLQSVGIDKIITIDLHASQIQGFYKIPIENLYAKSLLIKSIDVDNPLIVSPDVGGVTRARGFAKDLSTDLAIVDKRRERANEASVVNIIGSVAERNCVIVDDIIDTAGTLCSVAEALKSRGAKSVSAMATHGLFSGRARDRINESCLSKVVVTDTVPKPEGVLKKIQYISVAGMIKDVISRCDQGYSLGMYR